MVLAALVACLVFVALCVLAWLRFERRGRLVRSLRGDLGDRDRFIAHLREVVYRHREVEPDSPLAVIIADEIARFVNQREIQW